MGRICFILARLRRYWIGLKLNLSVVTEVFSTLNSTWFMVTNNSVQLECICCR